MAAAHTELVELLRNGKTRHAFFNQESGDAACAQLWLGFGVNHQRVGVGAVGNPHLAAVEQVVTALVFGLELHADDVRAGTGLAHRQRADMLAADQFAEVFGFLRRIAVAIDLVDAQVAVRAIRQTD